MTNDAIVAMTRAGTAFLSSDDGAVWRPALMAATRQTVTCMEIPAGTPVDGPFYFGTAEDGVYVAARDGDVYQAQRIGLSGEHITSLASTKDRDGRLVLLATTWSEALFRSDDEGATWRHGDANLTTDDQADVFHYPHFKGIAIANDFATQPTIFLGAYDGLFKSIDGGATWRELDTLSPGLIVGFDLTTDEQGELVIGASTYAAGMYFFHPRDMSWRVANVGLVSTRMGTIAFSPDFATDKTVFAGMWGRVAKSTDGGARWHTAHLWSSTIRWLAWLLGIANRSPIFPRVIAASPNFAADGTLFVGIRQSGLYSSTDAGETYSKVWNTDGKPVLALAFSPTFADDGTAVAVLTDSLHKTTDRGHSWLPIRDCDGSCRPALAMSPDFRRDQTIFAADHSGLLRTQDGGATWQSLSTAQCCQTAIDSIALSPAFATDHELLISLTGIGLLRSRDGGSSFEPVAQSVTDLGVSLSRFVDFPDRAPSVRYSTQFADDQTIVASSWETLFFSSDRGERWSPIPTPPIRYENTHSAIVYHGSWQLRVRGDRYSGTSVAASEAPGVEVVTRFVGHGFRLIASRGPDQGVLSL